LKNLSKSITRRIEFTILARFGVHVHTLRQRFLGQFSKKDKFFMFNVPECLAERSVPQSLPSRKLNLIAKIKKELKTIETDGPKSDLFLK
jgi:hypothetical protein